MFNPKEPATTKFAQNTPGPQSRDNSTAIDGACSAAVIQRFMQERIGAALEVNGESLDPTAPVTSYGLDSMASFTLTLELAEFLERDLPASLFWEYPSIAELAQELGKQER